MQLLRNTLKQELRDQGYWNGSSSCPNKKGERRNEWGNIFLEEFDRSLLDGLLWKKESFWCPLPNLSSFPLSSFWPMREERGKDRRWDRELSAVWCPGTLSPALISSDSAASLGLICTIAGSLCNVQPTTYCIDPLFCSVERDFICPLYSALNNWAYDMYSRWLVQFDAFFYLRPHFTDLMMMSLSFLFVLQHTTRD